MVKSLLVVTLTVSHLMNKGMRGNMVVVVSSVSAVNPPRSARAGCGLKMSSIFIFCSASDVFLCCSYPVRLEEQKELKKKAPPHPSTHKPDCERVASLR